MYFALPCATTERVRQRMIRRLEKRFIVSLDYEVLGFKVVRATAYSV
jgi:hypothetical protein